MNARDWANATGEGLKRLTLPVIQEINDTLMKHGFVIVTANGVQSPQANLKCVGCGFPSTPAGSRLCMMCIDIKAAEAYMIGIENKTKRGGCAKCGVVTVLSHTGYCLMCAQQSMGGA